MSLSHAAAVLIARERANGSGAYTGAAQRQQAHFRMGSLLAPPSPSPSCRSVLQSTPRALRAGFNFPSRAADA
eukprot:5165416-Pyramimonas_sp.AAC.1